MLVTNKATVAGLFGNYKKAANDNEGIDLQEFINQRQPDLRDFIIGRASTISENESRSEEVFAGAMFILSFVIYAYSKCNPNAPKFTRNNVEESVAKNGTFTKDVTQMLSRPDGESLFENLHPQLTANQVFRCVLDLTADLDHVLDFENRATVEEILLSTKIIIDVYGNLAHT